MFEAMAGLLVGALAIMIAKLAKGESWMYSVCLIALPGIYCLFALYAGDPATGMKELMMGIPFLVAGFLFALICLPVSAYVIGGLWLLHAVYDLTHDMFFTNPGAPEWYPVFCASVDFVIGLYVLWLCMSLKKPELHTT